MTCDTCGEEEAAFIVGVTETGEQKFLGPGCFARFGLEFAKAILPAEEVAAQLGPMFVNPTREPKRRGRREPEPEPEPEPGEEPEEGTEPPAGEAEASPAAENG